MKKYLIFTIIIAITLFVGKDLFFSNKFPSTHDGQNHLARMANYYLALRQGQFPPRWAPNLEAGLGYPTLNFNYPLANILSVIPMGLKLNPEIILKCIYALSIFFAGMGMYRLLKDVYGPKAGLISAFVYMTAPYQLGNIYIRGNIGESLSFGLMPWVAYFLIKFSKQEKYSRAFSIATSLLLLSHNIIAALSLPIIIIAGLYLFKKSNYFLLMRSLMITISLVSFFWIPALSEKSWTILDKSPLTRNQLYQHFLRFDQLFFSAWDHGYSYTFPVDGITTGLGALVIVAILMAIPLSVAQFKSKKIETIIVMLAVMTIYMMTPASEFIWRLVPMVAIIQFPWRLLFFATFFGSVLAGFVASKIHWSISLISVLITIIQLGSITLGINYFHESNLFYLTFPLNTTILNENDPVWYERLKAHDLKDQSQGPLILPASESAKLISWTGTKHVYELESRGGQVIEKTIYFPGWQTKIDGKKIDTFATKSEKFGLINYRLDPGKHIIETKFTQNTFARILGNSLSIVGLLGLIFYKKSMKKA